MTMTTPLARTKRIVVWLLLRSRQLASALMSPNDDDNAVVSNEEDRGSATAEMPRAGRPKGTTNDEKTE